jgi:HD-GYP domain-containing protein (c-di-GMP phosphodiesterase class II)/DNA-binding response OmpR family regulator
VSVDSTTVLVLSRDPQDLRIFGTAVRRLGLALDDVDNAADARARIAERAGDIVIIDVADAALEGESVLATAREWGDAQEVPVVVVLDRGHLERSNALMDKGADFLLLKPLEPAVTQARIAAAQRHRLLALELHRQLEHFKVLNQIGIALSAERNTERLLERILLHAMDITEADGGSLYLMGEDEQQLRFAIMRTESLGRALGGTTGHEVPFAPLDLYDPETGAPNHRNVATHVALTGETVNLPDAYEAQGFDLTGTRRFDAQNDYRSKSFLTIPMKNNAGDVIGVLQLINATDARSGEVVPFSGGVQEVVESLASQAAVAIDNQLLLQGQRELLDSFIRLIAVAIDAKSPYTGGHCARVPVLTEMLADAACESRSPKFADFALSDDERYELMTAAWMHDCGKVTTPEYVVDKATKLETICDRLEIVRARAEVLKRDAMIARLQAEREPGADAAQAREDYERRVAEIDEDLAFIAAANVGGEFMSDEAIARIERIAAANSLTLDGERRPLLSDDEVHNLSIRRGTLTPEERKTINHHIVMTIEMLEKLPFPKKMRRVPEYAGGHHERMDGHGYPRGLKRWEMSVPARMIAIADVFEALTAADRPYKPAMPLSRAMDILGKMKLDHHIDPDLFDLFVENKVYLRYAEQYLTPEQIDEVDVTKYLGPLPDAVPESMPATELAAGAAGGPPAAGG